MRVHVKVPYVRKKHIKVSLFIFDKLKSFHLLSNKPYTNITSIQGVYKWMVQFQKLTRNLFLTLHGTTYAVSSGNSPSFSCATSSSILMLTAGPRGQFPRWRRSRKNFLCVPFWGVQICDYSAAWDSCTVITDLRNKFLVNFWNRTILLCISCSIQTYAKVVVHDPHPEGHTWCVSVSFWFYKSD